MQPRLEKLIGEHLESTRVAYSPLTSDVLHRIQSAETPVPLQLQDAGSKFLNHNISNDGRKRGDISSTSTTKKAPGALAASRLNVSTTSLLSAASTAYSGNEVNCNVNSGDSNVDDADKDGDWEDAGLFIAECETPALSTVSGSGSFSSSRDIAAARGGAMPPPASVRGAVSNVVVATFSSGDSKSAQSTVVVENHSYTDFDRLFSDSSNSNSGGGGKQQSSAATTLQETAGLLNKAAEKLPKKAKKRDREVETGASAFRAEKAAKKQSNSAIKEVNINVKKKSKKSSNRSSGGGKEDDIDNIFGGL